MPKLSAREAIKRDLQGHRMAQTENIEKQGMRLDHHQISHVDIVDPSHDPGTRNLPFQPREVKMSTSEVGRRVVETRERIVEPYRGDPRAYDPRDPRYGYKMGPSEGVVAMAAPPPAHSHHRSDPMRPHSEPMDRSRSPAGRAQQQPTPPSMWASQQAGTPYPQSDRRGSIAPPDAAVRSQSAGRQQIGQPPPLININESASKAGHVGGGGRLSPVGRYPPHHAHHLQAGGSITQGIPAQHQQPSSSPQQASRTGSSIGSISMGTPRLRDQHHLPQQQQHHQQQSAPTQQQARHEGGGSITQGTPVGYEHPVSRGGSGGVQGQPTQSSQDHKRYMSNGAAVNQFEQMMRKQMSPTRTSAPTSSSTNYPHSQSQAQGYMIPEMQSRATLMGDFLTAQQMKEDRRTTEHDGNKQPQHSPRGSTAEQVPRREFPSAILDPRNPQAAVLDPRNAQQAAAYGALQTSQGLLYVPYHAAAIAGEQRRMSPAPRSVSPAEQERERRQVLKNAVEMRGQMPPQASHWPPSQKIPPQPQHSPGGLRQPTPTSSHHTRTQTPPMHRGVIMEVPHQQSQSRMSMMQQQQQQMREPVSHSSSASALLEGHRMQKDVHQHQSNEQLQFLEIHNRGRRDPSGTYKHHEKAQEKHVRKFLQDFDENAYPSSSRPSHYGDGHPPASSRALVDHRTAEGMNTFSPSSSGSSSHGGERERQQQHLSVHHSHSTNRSSSGPSQSPSPMRDSNIPHSMQMSGSAEKSGGIGERPRTSTPQQIGNANNSSSNSSGDKDQASVRTLTAASLIDIIITNQINSHQVVSNKGKGNILGKLEESEHTSTNDKPVENGNSLQYKNVYIHSQQNIGGSLGGLPPHSSADIPPQSYNEHFPGSRTIDDSPHKQQQNQHFMSQQNRFDEQIATMTKNITRAGPLEENQRRMVQSDDSQRSQSPRPVHPRNHPAMRARIDNIPNNKDETNPSKSVTLGETIDSIIVQDYKHPKHAAHNGEQKTAKDTAVQNAVRCYLQQPEQSTLTVVPTNTLSVVPNADGSHPTALHNNQIVIVTQPPKGVMVDERMIHGCHSSSPVPPGHGYMNGHNETTPPPLSVANVSQSIGMHGKYSQYPYHLQQNHVYPEGSRMHEFKGPVDPSKGGDPKIDMRDRDIRGQIDPRDVREPPHRPRSGSGVLPQPSQHRDIRANGPPGFSHHQPGMGVAVSSTGGVFMPPHHQGGQKSPEEGRPRSSSMGSQSGSTPWRLKRALQQEREPEFIMREQERQQQRNAIGPQQVPPAQPARSPVILPSDEREIVKVARMDSVRDVHSKSPHQSHVAERSPHMMGHMPDRRSPALGSTVENSSKPSSPRSPRGSQQYSQNMANMMSRQQLQQQQQSESGRPPPHNVQDSQLSPLDVINNRISDAINDSRRWQSEENSRSEEMKVVENDSRFYPMATQVPGNGGKIPERQGSGGGSRTPTQEAQTHRCDFLRNRYYKEASPRKEEQQPPTSGSSSSRKSPMPLLYPQSSRDSQGSNGGSPTRTSRPASRSSQPGDFMKQPAQSPMSSDSYRYSPRGSQRQTTREGRVESSNSPYTGTPHQSPSGGRMPVPSPHMSEQQQIYSRSNSGGSASSPRTSNKLETVDSQNSPPRIVIDDSGSTATLQGNISHGQMSYRQNPSVSQSSSGNQSSYHGVSSNMDMMAGYRQIGGNEDGRSAARLSDPGRVGFSNRSTTPNQDAPRTPGSAGNSNSQPPSSEADSK